MSAKAAKYQGLRLWVNQGGASANFVRVELFLDSTCLLGVR